MLFGKCETCGLRAEYDNETARAALSRMGWTRSRCPEHPAPKTALTKLAAALREKTTSAWSVEYAPDGDADAALKRAWDAEPRGGPVLAVAMASSSPHSAALSYALSVVLGARPTADELRRYIPCPAFAELTRELTLDDLGRIAR